MLYEKDQTNGCTEAFEAKAEDVLGALSTCEVEAGSKILGLRKLGGARNI